MELGESHAPDFDPEIRKAKLLQDIRAVDWGKQVPHFHLNTKLAHLITDGCLLSDGWLESCEKFVSSLPDVVVICGWRSEPVDPFRGARDAFPSNRVGKLEELPAHVMSMWNAARAREETSHTGLGHGNLLEILEMSGILNSGDSRNFYLGTLGFDRTPADEAEELLLECEGEALLGGSDPLRIAEGISIHRGVGGRNILWEESGGHTYLSMEGYGCICRWRVLHEHGAVVVVQSAGAVHTSVTNLAEQVRDACRARFGEHAKCYEFYEPWEGERASLPCEITGANGEGAGWCPVHIESLPALAKWLEGRGEFTEGASPLPDTPRQTPILPSHGEEAADGNLH